METQELYKRINELILIIAKQENIISEQNNRILELEKQVDFLMDAPDRISYQTWLDSKIKED